MCTCGLHRLHVVHTCSALVLARIVEQEEEEEKKDHHKGCMVDKEVADQHLSTASKVTLHLSCKRLKNVEKDFTENDSYVIVYAREEGKEEVEIGRTETKNNTANP